jgi:hypothetical protein
LADTLISLKFNGFEPVEPLSDKTGKKSLHRQGAPFVDSEWLKGHLNPIGTTRPGNPRDVPRLSGEVPQMF